MWVASIQKPPTSDAQSCHDGGRVCQPGPAWCGPWALGGQSPTPGRHHVFPGRRPCPFGPQLPPQPLAEPCLWDSSLQQLRCAARVASVRRVGLLLTVSRCFPVPLQGRTPGSLGRNLCPDGTRQVGSRLTLPLSLLCGPWKMPGTSQRWLATLHPHPRCHLHPFGSVGERSSTARNTDQSRMF